MFKRLFSLSNPWGIAFTAAAVLLTVSPEARKGTRKVFVKGAAALLSVGDQVKELTMGARKELGTFVEEAKEEREYMSLPDFSEMIKNTGEATKTKVNSVFDDMKAKMDNTPKFAHSMEMGKEFMNEEIEDLVVPSSAAKKANQKTASKSKAIPPANVLSNEAFQRNNKKPPIQ